jgi:hypothetical protein
MTEKGGGVIRLRDAGEEGEGADIRGPRVSDRREREGISARKPIPMDTPRAFGPIGSAKEVVPTKGGRASAADLGQSGQTPGRIPMEV